MIYLVTASKDSTVYQRFPNKNAGLDEIIQVSNGYTGLYERDVARSFLHFNINGLPSHVTASSTILSLQIAEVEEIPLAYDVYGYPVSQSWDMGIGTWPEDINTDGITWNNQPKVLYSPFAIQHFEYSNADLNMDIKEVYNFWTSSANYGIRLSHLLAVENNSLNYGYLKYYSKETNTYKQPLLKLGWDDQQYNTGSLTSVGTDEIVVKSRKLRSEYPIGKLIRIDLSTRNRFPVKTFTNSFGYRDMNYLPTTSYYSVEDVITKNTIIERSQFTKISCDPSGSYIMLDTTNFPQHRPLQLNFYVHRNGVEEIYKDDLSFIVR